MPELWPAGVAGGTYSLLEPIAEPYSGRAEAGAEKLGQRAAAVVVAAVAAGQQEEVVAKHPLEPAPVLGAEELEQLAVVVVVAAAAGP